MGYGLWRRKTDVDSLHNWKYPSMFSEAVRWRDLVLIICIIHGPNRLGNHSVSCFLLHVSCFVFLDTTSSSSSFMKRKQASGHVLTGSLDSSDSLDFLVSPDSVYGRHPMTNSLWIDTRNQKPQFPASRDVIWTVVMALPPLKRFRT